MRTNYSGDIHDHNVCNLESNKHGRMGDGDQMQSAVYTVYNGRFAVGYSARVG